MPPISLCIIGKNEEQHIENCLAPLAPLPFEIVYVDCLLYTSDAADD